MTGYKNRSPALWYSFPEDTVTFPDVHPVKLGLSDIAYWTTTDEERKLMFAADRERIKSYAWGPPSGNNYRAGLPTHTLDTDNYEGPLAVLSGGRLVRAGKGSVGVWNLDTLPTHGAKGKTRVGKKMSVEDTWRDDPESIETSYGSPPDTTIALELSNLSAAAWHPHPSHAGNMICAFDPRKSTPSCYSCISVDLEHGGKTVVKYLGHGAGVNEITTSPGDPNRFVTASDDGFARLFDVRLSLPVLTLRAAHPSGGCPAVVMVHPQGIPSAYFDIGFEGTGEA
jgi:WD40 repeat protein